MESFYHLKSFFFLVYNDYTLKSIQSFLKLHVFVYNILHLFTVTMKVKELVNGLKSMHK